MGDCPPSYRTSVVGTWTACLLCKGSLKWINSREKFCYRVILCPFSLYLPSHTPHTLYLGQATAASWSFLSSICLFVGGSMTIADAGVLIALDMVIHAIVK